jgi:hypothetical protein
MSASYFAKRRLRERERRNGIEIDIKVDTEDT